MNLLVKKKLIYNIDRYIKNNFIFSDPRLLCSKDASKDQTLFLSQISNKALRKTMFPLGDLMKTEVKKIAEMNGLELLSRKKESVGICFIGPRNFQDFISEVYIFNIYLFIFNLYEHIH